MFRFFVVSAIMASAMAFAPSAMRSSRSALRMNFAEELPGATQPFGFFDPLGLSKGKDVEQIRIYREAELKHGRVSMLAALGIIAAEEAELDNTPLYGDKIVGPAIYQFQEADQLTGFAFGFGILALIALLEFTGINKGWETVEQKAARDPLNKSGSQLAPGYVNGDLGFDPLGLAPKDADAFAAMQTKEINNGRLAMIATAGMLVQELINGKGVLENLGLEAALPAAFDKGTF